jgi:hypothetical protein
MAATKVAAGVGTRECGVPQVRERVRAAVPPGALTTAYPVAPGPRAAARSRGPARAGPGGVERGQPAAGPARTSPGAPRSGAAAAAPSARGRVTEPADQAVAIFPATRREKPHVGASWPRTPTSWVLGRARPAFCDSLGCAGFGGAPSRASGRCARNRRMRRFRERAVAGFGPLRTETGGCAGFGGAPSRVRAAAHGNRRIDCAGFPFHDVVVGLGGSVNDADILLLTRPGRPRGCT